MPKLKTKSGAKKRFRVTASGRIRLYQAGRRHNLIKRTQKMKRKSRGSALMCKADASIVRRFLPYGGKARN